MEFHSLATSLVHDPVEVDLSEIITSFFISSYCSLSSGCLHSSLSLFLGLFCILHRRWLILHYHSGWFFCNRMEIFNELFEVFLVNCPQLLLCSHWSNLLSFLFFALCYFSPLLIRMPWGEEAPFNLHQISQSCFFLSSLLKYLAPFQLISHFFSSMMRLLWYRPHISRMQLHEATWCMLVSIKLWISRIGWQILRMCSRYGCKRSRINNPRSSLR